MIRDLILGITIIIVSLWGLASYRSTQHYHAAKMLESQGDLLVARERYQWSMRTYALGLGYAEESAQALWRLGHSYYKAKDPQQALYTLDLLRGGIWATQSLFTPFAHWQDQVNQQIAEWRAQQAWNEQQNWQQREQQIQKWRTQLRNPDPTSRSETDAKQTDAKQTDAKQTDAKQTDAKITQKTLLWLTPLSLNLIPLDTYSYSMQTLLQQQREILAQNPRPSRFTSFILSFSFILWICSMIRWIYTGFDKQAHRMHTQGRSSFIVMILSMISWILALYLG
jgi:hypothetical protein